MKRLLLTAIVAIMACGVVSAQKYFVIDSEKVFKSLDEYNKAIEQLNELNKKYQADVEEKYKSIETLYNSYMAQKTSLSAAARATIEQRILNEEQEAEKYQESLFGQEGTLMKKRVELIKPIQTKVFAAIEAYAKKSGYDLVLDKASNTSILYVNEAIDHTAQIIEALK